MKNRNYILDCEIVHRIHGRIRIKSKSLKYLGIYKKEVEEQLKQVHYIQSVEISSITGTIVIYFDDFSFPGYHNGFLNYKYFKCISCRDL